MTGKAHLKKAFADVLDNNAAQADSALTGLQYGEMRYLCDLCEKATVALGWAAERVSLWIYDIVTWFQENLCSDRRAANRMVSYRARQSDYGLKQGVPGSRFYISAANSCFTLSPFSNSALFSIGDRESAGSTGCVDVAELICGPGSCDMSGGVEGILDDLSRQPIERKRL
jgi:hypothetical protein